MEALQIAFAIGFLIFLASLLVLYGLFRRPVNLQERLKSAPAEHPEAGISGVVKRLESILIPIGEMLPRSPAEMSRQEKKLVQAGIRRKEAVLLLNAAHVVIAVLFLLLFATTGYLYRQPMQWTWPSCL
jgi:hypothetical protein